jgi:hypothetical protein
LLGLIFLTRSAVASGDELRDLSAEGANPIPILSPASVSPRFFAWFLVAYLEEFVFYFFLVVWTAEAGTDRDQGCAAM